MQRSIALIIFGIGLLLIGISGCARNEPTIGEYRATLTLPGGELPFLLKVSRSSDAIVLTLANGKEHVTVSDLAISGGRLTARFPGMGNRLEATMRRRSMAGDVVMIRKGGEEQRIPFRATLVKQGQMYSFYKESLTDNADLSGRWEVSFTDDEGKSYPAVAEFEQSHDRVSGTFLTPTGDHHFLNGQVHDDELRLAMFSGAHAFLYHARLNEQDELAGEYWSGLHGHERWRAKRNPEARLPTNEPPPAATIEFSLPDINGKSVSLSDERFKNKVVLVTLGGSWCGNCHDEAAFLVRFYQRYRDKGFEVVGLMFERFGDFDQSSRAVKRFTEHHHIDYPLLMAGISDADEASKLFPQLPAIYAFPTAILLDRHGKVRSIHSGFSGPATGQHYDDYQREFTARVEQLLSES